MEINNRSLIEGLSHALDLAEKSHVAHSKHVAYTSVMIAKELKLPIEEQEDIYYAALLHDIGVSNTYLIEEHCQIGRDIILKLPVKDIIAEYVYYHHEHLDGSGPFKLKGDEIPLPAQIICMTNLFDSIFGKVESLNLDVNNEMKKWINDNKELFDSKIVDAFLNIIEKEYILLDYFSSEFNNVLFRKIGIQDYKLDFKGVQAFAHAFSQIIDMKSKFTYEHSVGIANLVRKITSKLEYNCEIQNKMHIAALLHDIGKLAISNDIIDKEGKS